MAANAPHACGDEVKFDNDTSQDYPTTLSKNQQKKRRKMEMKLKHRAEKRFV